MATVDVRVTFQKNQEGAPLYTLLHVYHLTDPKEGMKATVIEGKRGDGSICIPGGKKSQTITVRGTLLADDYRGLSTLINDLKDNITTDEATLKLQYKNLIGNWIDDWSYTVRRIDEIKLPFSDSYRTAHQEYEIDFLVLAY